jgi:uncharacterized protein (TIGR00730 family)
MAVDRRLTICAYCGSRAGADPRYADAGRSFGRAVAERGHALVFGGGSVGLMGPVADGALAAGGRVIGVMPRGAVERERPHSRVERLELVADQAERTRRMADQANALVALPGGYGVLAELFEALTWVQADLHAGPCAALNAAGFFDHLVRHLDHAADADLITREDRERLIVRGDPGALVDAVVRAVR